MSSSGAPKKIEGMKSTKVWVIEIETMKLRGAKGLKFENLVITFIRIMLIRFMWIPGVRPVKVPKNTPNKVERIISNNTNFQ